MAYSDLKGKTFIITGAASGMGRTTSLALAQQGANVGLLDLRKPDNTLEEIEKIGGQALSLACNVQDRAAIHAAVQAVSEKFGGIDGAANMAGYVGNQGLYGKGYALDIIQDDDWDGVLATNLNGLRIVFVRSSSSKTADPSLMPRASRGNTVLLTMLFIQFLSGGSYP